MRVFVCEHLCSGACAALASDSSLLREGRSMLLALIADCAGLPGVRVSTLWDARLEDFPLHGIDVHNIVSPKEEAARFAELAGSCDATLVIAPETGGILADRCRIVEGSGGHWLGCSLQAIELCGDKLRLSEFLQKQGIPTLPTHALDARALPADRAYPIVVKPRDGAGSENTFLIGTPAEFREARRCFESNEAVWQPFLAGQAVSIAAMIDPVRGRCELLPPAEQHLSRDGRFRYLSGRVPADAVDPAAVSRVVSRVCTVLPGLAGYVGFDLIVPPDSAPVLVEINPRLTTSYLGYRQLSETNLATMMLGRSEQWSAPVW